MAIRLFVSEQLQENGTISLRADQAHYLSRVMRLKAGVGVLLFNGRDGEYSAELVEVGKTVVVARIRQQTRQQKKSPDLWLLFAPVKRAPLDQIAQKATELGVALLQPVRTERTIVTRVREDRLLANAVEAAEQCERLDVPDVRPFEKLESVLSDWPKKNPGRQIIFCDEAGDEDGVPWGGETGRAQPLWLALAPFKKKPDSWAILTGPEGGFTPEERNLLRQQAFVTPVTLGPRILRADTAAFAAITLWQAVLGDLAEPFTKA